MSLTSSQPRGYGPAGGRAQKLRDLPPYGDCKQSPAGQWIAIPAVLASQYGHIVDERLLIIRHLGTSALRRAMLSEHAADPPLGQLQFGSNVINAGTTPRRAQKFPLAASARIILSSVRSDAARRNRAFSASRSFIRLT
ncbi:hypothetical protein MCEMSEM23_00592 [Rhabdaerophilaceae bacterium]